MTPEEAEQAVLSLELFGMRFGLDRMRRLMTALGHPEQQFRSIHVVGTNGKSSTVRMTAAILAEHGLRVGSYLSPHLVSFAERIRVGDADITQAQFAAAVERALHGAELVNRSASPDDSVTQFELLTAAAYSELSRQGVEAAVIEAGLGGHYDATNVIPSEVQILTSVGLEHTRWLGSTIIAIAREKLDVVQPGATLVLGSGMHPDAVAVAVEIASERGATIVQADSEPHASVGALGTFQRRNFAAARAAAEVFLGDRLEQAAVNRAAAAVRVPGRLQIVSQRPLTLLDGAHNPDGISALVESLPEITGGRRLVAAVSILEDKNAAQMLSELAPLCDALILTSSQNPRSLPPPTLASLLEQLPLVRKIEAETIRDAGRALRRARELAGDDGVAIATGSLYLIADLLAELRGQHRSASIL